MDLEQAIRTEHSKSQCDRIVAYVGGDQKRFTQLMKLFFGREYRISQRAAWPVSYCVRFHPALVRPYFKRLLDALVNKRAHPAVRRNIVRLLQDVEIPARYQGRLMAVCFDFISSPTEAIAVKAFSLTILGNMVQQYPEIFPEIKAIIEDRWEQETPAFHSRAKRILKKHLKNQS